MVMNVLQGYKYKDNCWICEGWSEMYFEIKSIKLEANVYIHFDFDQYKPDLVTNGDVPGLYALYRMVPPGNHKYFFTIEGEFTLTESGEKQALDLDSFMYLRTRL